MIKCNQSMTNSQQDQSEINLIRAWSNVIRTWSECDQHDQSVIRAWSSMIREWSSMIKAWSSMIRAWSAWSEHEHAWTRWIRAWSSIIRAWSACSEHDQAWLSVISHSERNETIFLRWDYFSQIRLFFNTEINLGALSAPEKIRSWWPIKVIPKTIFSQMRLFFSIMSWFTPI